MYQKKNKIQENPSIVLNPAIQEQDEFSQQIYNQQQPVNPQQFQQNQPMQSQPVQVQVQQKPDIKAVITKVELTEGIIKFEGQANYLINIGDCQIN